MTYVVGVSSGIFGAASTEERMQGISVGLYKKAQFCITKGVEFVQIDLESISEFKEPNLKDNMEKLKRMGITFGIHSEVAAFGGREFPHLDSAIGVDYERSHKRLITVLEETGKLGAKFVLIHSSESTPFLLLVRELQPTDIVDFWGRPLEKIIFEQTDLSKPPNGRSRVTDIKKIEPDDITPENNWLWKWIRNTKYLWIDLIGDEPEEIIKRRVELTKLEQKHRMMFSAKVDFEEKFEKEKGRSPTEEETKEEMKEKESEVDKFIKKEEEMIFRNTRKIEEKELKDIFFRTIKSKSLHYGPERHAYYIVAKWMEKNNDHLWNNIIKTSIKYYAEIESKAKGKKITEEEWLKERSIEKVDGKWSIDNENFRLAHQLWVPAVSAKYVWGHFNPEKCPDPKQKDKYPDPKEIIKKYKDFVFTLETPMASPGIEEYLRFPNPLQIYELCKEVDLDVMQLAIDIEHMLMSNQDPEVTFELMPEDAGKYVRVIHAGWPSPLGPAHIPILLGSEQHLFLYRMYYLLRQKGFGKDKSDYYLVFERGGGADPIQQSIIALKLITKFLEKDTKPEDLPNEFFGIEVGQIASMERQRVAIEEHARDPLKGLITVPEEEYTFLGRSALEKGKRPEEWKKEELR